MRERRKAPLKFKKPLLRESRLAEGATRVSVQAHTFVQSFVQKCRSFDARPHVVLLAGYSDFATL
jgi:hypothetical protein